MRASNTLQGEPTNGGIDTARDRYGGKAWVRDCHIKVVLATVLYPCLVDDEVALQSVYAAGLAAIQVDVPCGAVGANPLLPQTRSLRVSVVVALLRRQGESDRGMLRWVARHLPQVVDCKMDLQK